MNIKALFSCGEGSNLILGIGRESQIFFLRTPAPVKFFDQIVKNDTLAQKNSLHTQMDLYNPYMVLHTISYGNYNFPRSINKINFFDKISSSGNICRFNEFPKI